MARGNPKGSKRGYKTGGRQKGTPNKITTSVRENTIAVFEQIGGINAMAKWARTNRTQFYMLYGKLVPSDPTTPGHPNMPISHNHKIEVVGVVPVRTREGGDDD